jgi:hypothetical protein
MKRLYILVAIALAVTVSVATMSAHQNAQRHKEWESTREVITVTVPAGAGLDYFGAKYKPDWMDMREYRQAIKSLNDMTSSMLIKGQTLKINFTK